MSNQEAKGRHTSLWIPAELEEQMKKRSRRGRAGVASRDLQRYYTLMELEYPRHLTKEAMDCIKQALQGAPEYPMHVAPEIWIWSLVTKLEEVKLHDQDWEDIKSLPPAKAMALIDAAERQALQGR